MSWSLELGPFVLDHPIGRGGMGEVWLARHRVDGVRVAIKVLTHAGAGDPKFIASFRDEVRAVAALDHPAIVRVYDYGVVPDPAPRDPEGNDLPASSPYLAMELLEGGTLKDLCGTSTWPEIQSLLLGLLDALAHAHARGVTHRDLKPANILLGESLRDLRLVDFGLAHAARGHAAGPSAQDRKVRGTPAYMAPEQWRGQWRTSGPWTDLYAVGCLGWALTTGEPPFGAKGTPQRLAESHCYAEPPALRAPVDVPEGFESWLRRLLEKTPEYRFRRAADAAWSLQDLQLSGAPDVAFRTDPSRATLSLVEPISAPSHGDAIEVWSSASHTLVLEPSTASPDGWTRLRTAWLMDRDDSELAPIPSNWRRPSDMAPPRRLTGVGLGLYGLRSIPLVDREAERDALWEELRAVRATRRARGVVLRGPAGSGKSRLAQWLSERAHELGGAGVMRALHSPMPGPVDGLGPMVARALSLVGLDREDTVGHLTELAQAGNMAPGDVLPLADLLVPDVEASERSDSLPGALETHLLIERHCHARTRDRSLILWLDDGQWGWEALGLARYLLSGSGAEIPALVVVTVRDDALEEQPAEAERVAALEDLGTVRRLDIEALPEVHRKAMIDALLGLDPALAKRVEDRTDGNPLFAVQLVGDWVHRGLLEPGDRGFRLISNEDATAFPDSLHEIWLRRLDRLLRDRPDTDLVALEVAAALGLQIAVQDWRVACNEAEANPSPGLVDALLFQRLARREGGGDGSDWAFVHGMLRESLERRAREEGRWPTLNLACAQMLEGVPGLRVSERMGRHLLAADRVEAALPRLAEGARLRLASGDYVLAAQLLSDREAAMRALPLPEDDPAWAVGWVHQARLERVSGDPDRSLEYSNRAAALAARIDHAGLQARALEEVARITNVTGDPQRAASLMAVACSLADQADDTRLAAQCRQARAETLLHCGALDEADAELRAALTGFESIGDLIGASRSRLGLGALARGRGEFVEGRVWLQSAMELCAEAGSRIGVAQCEHDLGENHRAAGDPLTAEGYYRKALEAFETLGSRDQIHCRINRALCLLSLGRPAEARDALEVGLYECIERRLVTIRAAVHVFLLPCFVADDDWQAWDLHFAQAQELLESTGFTDVDVGLIARLAGQMTFQAGEKARAAAILGLARDQWATLGRADELEAIDALLQHLDRGPEG